MSWIDINYLYRNAAYAVLLVGLVGSLYLLFNLEGV